MMLTKFKTIQKTQNGYMVHGDNADVMLVFMNDNIIRIRISFSRIFEECSYALVTTAWDDELDGLLADERTRINALVIPYKEDDTTVVFQTKTLRLVLNKEPFSFRLYDIKGTLIYQDLKERVFETDRL